MSSQVLSNQQSNSAVVWGRLIRGHATMRRTFDAVLQADHGLTDSDFEALLSLSRAEGKLLRRVDLAEALQITPSGVTRLLEGLEKQGLVQKQFCTQDARVTYAVLTDAGQAKLEQASTSHLVAVRALFEERYTAKELIALDELLSRLPGAAQADDCSVG
jgi:DNA-binding MarR family transcriptional regulator